MITSAVAFRFSSFDDFPLLHAMSGRTDDGDGGDVGYSPANDHSRIDANRDRFLQDAGIDAGSLTLGRQVHGSQVQVVRSEDRGRGRPPRFDGFPDTDALATAASEVTLGTVIADCAPLLVYDPRRHVVGVAHAGWRGTVAGIGGRLVESMSTTFGCDPADLVAGIGPSIGPCCYEVGRDVVDAWQRANFAERNSAIARYGSATHFDLWAANRVVLEAAGLSLPNIETAGLCTRCELEHFFSYRAAKSNLAPSGRMMLVAQLGEHL